MTASSPVTKDDLVEGLKFTSAGGGEYDVVLVDEDCYIGNTSYMYNKVSISSNGLTITFGNYSGSQITFTEFTFNA